MLVLLLFFTASLRAEVPVPKLTAQVVDTTGSLSSEQKMALVQKLQTFEATKGSQIAVLLVQTTQPETIEQYALRVAEQWKIGRGKIDDGAILVLALQDRTVRIEVGYGLEGALTDIASKRIIEDHIIPELRQGNLAGGINTGVDRMMNVIEGEPLPAPQRDQGNINQGGLGDIAPLLFMLALIVGGGLRRAIGKLPAAGLTGAVVFGVAWFLAGTLVVAILAAIAAAFLTLSGVRMGGLGGGFGGRGGPGHGGGGFSGGGGSFGGGGASGRW
ncbi:MAG TPA: YgcG family protein [Limnobacter sp.]|nr:YgcG family protein [Limnobacter sp.]